MAKRLVGGQQEGGPDKRWAYAATVAWGCGWGLGSQLLLRLAKSLLAALSGGRGEAPALLLEGQLLQWSSIAVWAVIGPVAALRIWAIRRIGRRAEQRGSFST